MRHVDAGIVLMRGCGRNTVAVPTAFVGRASPPAHCEDSPWLEWSCEDARQGGERPRSPYIAAQFATECRPHPMRDFLALRG